MSRRTRKERYPAYSIKAMCGPIPRWYKSLTRRVARKKQLEIESEADNRAVERERNGKLDWYY